MNKDKIHLVPTIVFDCCASALNPILADYQRDLYYAKIQAIAEYCDEAIVQYEKKFNKR